MERQSTRRVPRRWRKDRLAAKLRIAEEICASEGRAISTPSSLDNDPPGRTLLARLPPPIRKRRAGGTCRPRDAGRTIVT
jgi:hypothetical protein